MNNTFYLSNTPDNAAERALKNAPNIAALTATLVSKTLPVDIIGLRSDLKTAIAFCGLYKNEGTLTIKDGDKILVSLPLTAIVDLANAKLAYLQYAPVVETTPEGIVME